MLDVFEYERNEAKHGLLRLVENAFALPLSHVARHFAFGVNLPNSHSAMLCFTVNRITNPSHPLFNRTD
jgi:hypothetical protein